MRAIVIAGAASGVGKTTVAAVMGALTQRGYKVQPFKVGPDYIDPSYHSAICGFPCRNLDSWLLTPEVIRELFQRAMAGKDIAVIEGVMGLYDGANGDDEAGSTAQLAKQLGLPVALVVDASKSSRSVGAVALGFKAFDPALHLAGVILNGIGGAFHLDLALPSLHQAGVTYLGYLPGRADFTLPERHLGLVPTAEREVAAAYDQRLAQQAASTLDLERWLAVASGGMGPSPRCHGHKKKYGNLRDREYVTWLASFAQPLTELLAPDGSIVIELGNAWERGKPVMASKDRTGPPRAFAPPTPVALSKADRC